MKLRTLPVKRRPATKSGFWRLSAVTGNRKQRAAAAVPATEMDGEDSGSKISRALTIIFLVHIVIIGLIFFQQRYLSARPAENVKQAAMNDIPAATVELPRTDLPRLSSGEKPYIVKPGDNYSRIASVNGVNEQDLRLVNQHVDIGPGLILKIPPKRIVAEEPPEVAAIRAQEPSDQDRGMVEAVDVSDAPKARLVRPGVTRATASATPVAAPMAAPSGKTYVVQPGDSVFRIASRFKVDQTNLMQVNSISDPRKMKVGMKLVIPQG